MAALVCPYATLMVRINICVCLQIANVSLAVTMTGDKITAKVKHFRLVLNTCIYHNNRYSQLECIGIINTVAVQ